MSLSKWNKYLQSTNADLFSYKQDSQINNIIDYFSAPNVIDIFSFKNDISRDNAQFEFFKNNSALVNENSLYDIHT